MARRWVLYDLGTSTALSGISNGYRMEDISKLSKDQKLVFKTNDDLMQVKSIAVCSMSNIRQYF